MQQNSWRPGRSELRTLMRVKRGWVGVKNKSEKVSTTIPVCEIILKMYLAQIRRFSRERDRVQSIGSHLPPKLFATLLNVMVHGCAWQRNDRFRIKHGDAYTFLDLDRLRVHSFRRSKLQHTSQYRRKNTIMLRIFRSLRRGNICL